MRQGRGNLLERLREIRSNQGDALISCIGRREAQDGKPVATTGGTAAAPSKFDVLDQQIAALDVVSSDLVGQSALIREALA